MGVSGHFGLGRPLALREIPVLGRKMQFSGARGPFGDKIRTPQKFLPESAHFFTVYVFADRTPTGGKSRNVGFGSEDIVAYLMPLEIPGRKQKTTNSLPRWDRKEKQTPFSSVRILSLD